MSVPILLCLSALLFLNVVGVLSISLHIGDVVRELKQINTALLELEESESTSREQS